MWFITGILCSLIGYGIGIFVGVRLRHKSIGSIRIDKSDPDDHPYLFLELNRDINYLCSKKQVFVDVKIEDYIPQK